MYLCNGKVLLRVSVTLVVRMCTRSMLMSRTCTLLSTHVVRIEDV